jgi:4-amino-4-deoxy-L-arabinose transferase-like glycosyltransferase
MQDKRWVWLVAIFALAVIPRLVFVVIADHPGMWDPLEYYSLAVNLHEGRGFELDYIWSFASDPESVTRPLDHWLPLSGIVAAGSFALFGVSVPAALLPFVLLAGVLSVGVFLFAERIGQDRHTALFAALGAAYTPWLFLSALHTDTTTLFGVLTFGALAAVYLGVREENGRWFWLAGLLTGLGVLTRNDGVLLVPAGVLGGGWLAWRRGYRVQWRHVIAAGVLCGLVVLPWVLRNQAALGEPWPGSTAQTMLLTDHEDTYVYARDITLDAFLDQGWRAILGKIAFELAASVKIMITMVELLFPVAIIGGLLEVGLRRIAAAGDGDRAPLDLGPHLPALWFIILAYAGYGILMPYLSQGGSFKKAYLAAVPFLLIIGAQTVARYVRPRRAYSVVIAITLALLLASAVELTRKDFKYNNEQQTIYEDVGVVLDRLQAQQDQEIIVMTRDPWSLNYVTGYRAVMVPNEPLDVILDAADRYGVTHILAPTARDAIRTIDQGDATHPRLERVAAFPDHNKRLYRIQPAE